MLLGIWTTAGDSIFWRELLHGGSASGLAQGRGRKRERPRFAPVIEESARDGTHTDDTPGSPSEPGSATGSS